MRQFNFLQPSTKRWWCSILLCYWKIQLNFNWIFDIIDKNFSGLSYTGSTHALGACWLGSIPSSPTNWNFTNFLMRLPRSFPPAPRLRRAGAPRHLRVPPCAKRQILNLARTHFERNCWRNFVTIPKSARVRRKEGLGGGIPPHPRFGKIRADNYENKYK